MDELDYKALGFLLQAIQLVGTIAGFVWVIISNRQKANASAIETLRAEVDEDTEQLGNRLTRLEAQMEHMPGHEDLGEIHSRVNETAQRLTSMEGELKQMNHTMQLMHRHLLNGSKS
jgi:DNA repair exonuclease SbcCD ATPase subunit